MEYLSQTVSILLVLSLFVNAIQAAMIQRRRVTDLEFKVRFLFERTGIVYEPASMLAAAVRDAVANGKKIEAIKLYRDATGASLREAKNAVDRMIS